MSYEIHITIPEESSGGHLIASLTAEQHITPSQAVARIIDVVAQNDTLSKSSSATTAGDIVGEALRKVEEVRVERTLELVAMSARNGSAAKLIGFLKDEPELVEAIRQASKERRQAMYS